MAYFLGLVILAFSNHLMGCDLGKYSHTFVIEEEDLISYLEKKYKSLTPKEIEGKKRQVNTQILERVKNPDPIMGIEKSTKNRTYYFNPTLIVSKSIFDHEGKCVVAAGTKINPLEKTILRTGLLFIDGDDSEQVHWASTQKEPLKWILVSGNPLDLEKKLKLPIYFDQKGYLTKKLGIKCVPAIATQEKALIKIEEIDLERGR